MYSVEGVVVFFTFKTDVITSFSDSHQLGRLDNLLFEEVAISNKHQTNQDSDENESNEAFLFVEFHFEILLCDFWFVVTGFAEFEYINSKDWNLHIQFSFYIEKKTYQVEIQAEILKIFFKKFFKKILKIKKFQKK